MKKLLFTLSALLMAGTAMAADVKTEGNGVTIIPDSGQAKVLRLEGARMTSVRIVTM